MKFSIPLCIIVVTLFCLQTGCKRDTAISGADSISSYFPLQQGKYIVYSVDSMIWNNFTSQDTSYHYEMLYAVGDTFLDNNNRTSYRLYVSIRSDSSEEWQAQRVDFVTPTATRIEYIEGNLRFIKIVSPVMANISWNGNAFINFDDDDTKYLEAWNYVYKKVGETYNGPSLSFEKTVTVDQEDDSLNNPEAMPDAYAYKTYSQEVYAQHVGLVYKQLIHWTYDPSPPHPKHRSGFGITMKAIAFN